MFIFANRHVYVSLLTSNGLSKHRSSVKQNSNFQFTVKSLIFSGTVFFGFSYTAVQQIYKALIDAICMWTVYCVFICSFICSQNLIHDTRKFKLAKIDALTVMVYNQG